jgi:hypothetical protein
MSTEITVQFVKQYGANVFHLSQQKGSRLRSAVRVESVKGDSRFFDRIGKAVAQTRTSRHSDTPQMDTPHTRRMVTLVTKEYGDMVDDADKIRSLNDPTNDYSVAAQWALGRAMDDLIIDSASGSAYGGVNGTTAVALPTTQKIAAVASSALSSLNVAALRKASKILDSNDVDESEPRFCAFNALQKEALLGQTEVSSSDYNTVKALVMGQVDTFVGFKFIRTEQLDDQSGQLLFDATSGEYNAAGAVDGNGADKVLVWAKSGLLLGIGSDIKAEIAPDPSKSFSTRIYAAMNMGSTRMEEEKVVEVLCAD